MLLQLNTCLKLQTWKERRTCMHVDSMKAMPNEASSFLLYFESIYFLTEEAWAASEEKRGLNENELETFGSQIKMKNNRSQEEVIERREQLQQWLKNAMKSFFLALQVHCTTRSSQSITTNTTQSLTAFFLFAQFSFSSLTKKRKKQAKSESRRKKSSESTPFSTYFKKKLSFKLSAEYDTHRKSNTRIRETPMELQH